MESVGSHGLEWNLSTPHELARARHLYRDASYRGGESVRLRHPRRREGDSAAAKTGFVTLVDWPLRAEAVG